MISALRRRRRRRRRRQHQGHRSPLLIGRQQCRPSLGQPASPSCWNRISDWSCGGSNLLAPPAPTTMPPPQGSSWSPLKYNSPHLLSRPISSSKSPTLLSRSIGSRRSSRIGRRPNLSASTWARVAPFCALNSLSSYGLVRDPPPPSSGLHLIRNQTRSYGCARLRPTRLAAATSAPIWTSEMPPRALLAPKSIIICDAGDARSYRAACVCLHSERVLLL